MRILSFIILIFSLSCISDVKTKKEELISDKAKLSEVANTYFSKLAELGDFNGVVLLKKGEDVILKKAFNRQPDTTSTLYVHKESQFDLRSIAKLFAKLSVIQLEVEGKLSREDKLSRFLPDFPNADKITIQHLMTNTSGLPRSFEVAKQAYIEMTPDEVVALASKSDLEFEPGEKELYSNVGFQLLYYVIGKVSKTSFEDYIHQQFFKPLGMSNSGSNFYNGSERKNHYAFGHFNNNDSIVCECTFPDDEMKMGNLFSTVEDLERLLSSLESKTYQDLIHENIISHAGGTRGKRAYVERNYKEDYTLIFLSNYDDIPFEQIIKDSRHILKGEDVVMPEAINRKSVTVPVKVLKQYEGTYDLVDAGHILLSIKLENESLYVYQKGINNGVIVPESRTVFFSDSTKKESIEFVENENGTYDMLIDFQGVQWKGERIQNKN